MASVTAPPLPAQIRAKNRYLYNKGCTTMILGTLASLIRPKRQRSVRFKCIVCGIRRGYAIPGSETHRARTCSTCVRLLTGLQGVVHVRKD